MGRITGIFRQRAEVAKIFGYRVDRLDVVLMGVWLGLIGLLHANSLNVPFERDEGEYAYAAWLWREGGLPYRDTFLQKPPLIIYVYRLGLMMSESGLWPYRMLAMVALVQSCVLLALAARNYWGKRFFWTALYLSPVLVMIPPNLAFAANTERFMILPLSLLIYWRSRHAKRTHWWVWFGAGVWGALTVLVKQIGAIVVLFIWLEWLAASYRREGLEKLRNNVICLGLGAGSAALLSLWPFISVWNEVWEQTVLFNYHYSKYYGFSWSRIDEQISQRLLYLWLVILVTLGGIRKNFKGLAYWLGLWIAGLVSVVQSPLHHYYILLAPMGTLLVTGAIKELTQSVKRKSKAVGLWAGAVVISVILPTWPYVTLAPNELFGQIYNPDNPFREAMLVAEKLKEITRENDRVFVAGSEAQILFYAKRISVSKFVITYPLNFRTPYRDKYQESVIAELKKDPPAAVVVSQRLLSGFWFDNAPRKVVDYLNQELESNYELVGGYLWRGDKGRWLTTLKNNEKQQCSLLVYKKK